MVEIAIFVVVLTIAVIGASGYRYFSTLSIRKSDTEITAGRTATLLVESWKGVRGISTYDPLTDTGLGLTISAASDDLTPEPPVSFNSLGTYRVNEDNQDYYVTLSYYDVDSRLRVLNARLAWTLSPDLPADAAQLNKSFSLSALVTR